MCIIDANPMKHFATSPAHESSSWLMVVMTATMKESFYNQEQWPKMCEIVFCSINSKQYGEKQLFKVFVFPINEDIQMFSKSLLKTNKRK